MQELSLNILDVVQNSIAAGATLVRMELCYTTSSPRRLTVCIRDNGCGMEQEALQRVTDPFYTTRTTRKVGLGTSLFKMAAELTGGSFSVESQKGKGTAVTAVLYPEHLDAVPLGDIGATYVSLVQTNPQLDFVLQIACGEKGFEADTRVFKEVLEGVPIESPQVLAFIGGYIQEQLEALLPLGVTNGPLQKKGI